MKSYGWVLIQYDSCAQGYMHIEKVPYEDAVKRWPSASEGERTWKSQTCPDFDLELLASRTVRKEISII